MNVNSIYSAYWVNIYMTTDVCIVYIWKTIQYKKEAAHHEEGNRLRKLRKWGVIGYDAVTNKYFIIHQEEQQQTEAFGQIVIIEGDESS